MPKQEPDGEDPLELNGVMAPGGPDADLRQAEALAEEFLLLGYDRAGILELFRNPGYLATHRIWRSRGEPFVSEAIDRVITLWSREGDHA